MTEKSSTTEVFVRIIISICLHLFVCPIAREEEEEKGTDYFLQLQLQLDGKGQWVNVNERQRA